ncbi:hypothetical protein PV396_22150 [Streptomyces sp. ME02-8801-2C]|uniref:hypothetical protein n=1 Tax=Streptomyces sp. ME02-8801-2C TaxID=3028680 RepID=UPI0029B3D466|nr:hypothetical protein [Streptomyces sp. ME02-8801-2C]MDX3454614.1 hypothetical protein [Streptomyces sp. ME02-8801-2C]
MGLILFPGDGDASSPDVAWSCTGFDAFRRRLAQAEGSTLAEMRGFGGERAWCDVPTALAPLLNRPDNGGGELSSTECAAILPRLEAIADQWQDETGDSLLHQRHLDEARQLTAVLRLCVEKDVDLLFL